MPYVFLLLCFLSLPAFSQDRLAIDYNVSEKPSVKSYYRISGFNSSNHPEIVIIQINDQAHAAYHERVNEERWVLPGPFELWVQPAALQTPSGKFLYLGNLEKLVVFSPGDVTFQKIEKSVPPILAYAYDFGPELGPVFQGFEKLTAKSPFIKSDKLKPFIRKGADSLIRDGIKGITRLEIPIPNGQWLVHLWTEDIGEWETLPPLYERRIRVNGQTVQMLRQGHDQWVSSRYIQGRHAQGKTPWASFGQRRGGLVQSNVSIQNGMFEMDLAGSNVQATTITGLLLEPVGQDVFSKVQASRQNWFEKRWPYIIEKTPIVRAPQKIITFGGETLFIALSQKPETIPHPLQGRFFNAQKGFHRTQPNSGLLVRKARRFGQKPSAHASGYLRLTIPASTPAGSYELGELTLEVLNGNFPKIQKSVGIYLEEPPHLQNKEKINMQVWCDLDYLKRLGLTAIAPPFSQNIAADYRRAKSMDFQDVLAYTPVKRHLQTVKSALQAGGLNDLYFSIADEPSNPAQAQKIAYLSAQLQNASPFAKRAGHFNNPKDQKYLKEVDLALINSGFGVDHHDILKIKKRGVTPWFYNMENTRLASGFYLWRVAAEGYLQWHGRMPTADPFDPSDGREDDVQLLYPAETVCSQDQDIDIQLIDMVNGISDLRWLLWLDEKATSHQKARHLKRELIRQIPPYWKEARQKNPRYWDKLKRRIQELALHLQN